MGTAPAVQLRIEIVNSGFCGGGLSLRGQLGEGGHFSRGGEGIFSQTLPSGGKKGFKRGLKGFKKGVL